MWRPVRQCSACGSRKVEVDEANEFGKCVDCGHNWSGANFWEEPVPITEDEAVRRAKKLRDIMRR